jgi:hypothetical protein
MFRTVVLAIHILAVASWFGANITQLVLSPRYAKGDDAEAAGWTRQTIWLGERYYPAIGGLVALTGVTLVIDGPWDWSDRFVWIGIAVVIIGAVMGVAFFGPLGKRRLAGLESGDRAAADAAQARIIPLAYVDSTLIALAVLAMIDKWGA